MGSKAALMVSFATMRTWLLVVVILAVGGLALACSSGGGDDASPTATTPTDSGDAGSNTPSDGTTPGGSPATLEPGATGAPPIGNDGEPGGADGPSPTSQPPPLASGPAMRLTVLDGGTCDGSECFVDTGATFTLAVEVLRAPASGYVLMQTFIDFGVYNPTASEDEAGPGSCSDGVGNGGNDGEDRSDSECSTVALTYLPEPGAADEVVWGDAAEGVTLREIRASGLLQHGSLTGLIPPLPISHDIGVVVRVRMSCPARSVTIPITLLVSGDPIAGTSGSLFVAADGVTQIIPFVSPINLHCQ